LGFLFKDSANAFTCSSCLNEKVLMLTSEVELSGRLFDIVFQTGFGGSDVAFDIFKLSNSTGEKDELGPASS